MRHGRFSGEAAKIAQHYSESVSFDWRLYRYDIAGSLAHAAALAAAGIISPNELAEIEHGLRAIEEEINRGEFVWKPELEDLHMNIESSLTSGIGAAGAKLHTARSRNDQIALDLRMFARFETGEVQHGLRELQRALLEVAEAHRDAIMPGYTHTQRAQPILFAHHLLAHLEALERDHARLQDGLARINVMPLGSGALAGSTIVLDRQLIADRLGFPALSRNSLDAVGDRDFVAEMLFALALIGVHLSRLSEDIILWTTTEFGFATLSDDYSTGSSLMPQKKNSDMAELTRGRTGRLVGNLVALLTTLKGLPTSYQRDLQEDKEPLFDSIDAVKAALVVLSGLVRGMAIHDAVMEKAACDPMLLATDLAEYLVRKGLPFREAHDVVGRLVRDASCALDQIPFERLRETSYFFEADVAEVFNVRQSLVRRTAPGAPSPANVAVELERWRNVLASNLSS
ncbi:MAG: argininosuccinate lyase [Chthoniobacterales bacterium]|nr:argininosuccinate lyase [Chthoniobacterales bacterium]